MGKFLDNLKYGGLGYAVTLASDEARFNRESKKIDKLYNQRMKAFKADPDRVEPTQKEVAKEAQRIVNETLKKYEEHDAELKQVKHCIKLSVNEALKECTDEKVKDVIANSVAQVCDEEPENFYTRGLKNKIFDENTGELVQEEKHEQKVTENAAEEVKAEEVVAEAAVEEIEETTELSEDVVLEKIEGEIVTDIKRAAEKVLDKKMFDADRLAKNINDCEEALKEIGCTEDEIKVVVIALLFSSLLMEVEVLYRSIDPREYKKEIEQINGLVNAWTGITLNPNYEVPALEDVGDIEHIEKIVEFEKDYQGVSCPVVDVIYNKTKEKAAEIKKLEDKTPEESITTPIRFVDQAGNVTMAPPRRLGKSDIRFYEKKFGNVLKGYKYSFHNLGALDEIVIENDNNFRYYSLDKGHVFGIGPAVVVTINTGNGCALFPISILQDKKIVAAFIKDPNYQPTAEEMQTIVSRVYNDPMLYVNYDLTGIGNVRNSKTNVNEFYEKLVKISQLPWNTLTTNEGEQFPIVFPRMRIQVFKSLNNFVLISDEKVKVPYIYGFNSIISPMTIKVNGNKMEVVLDTVDGSRRSFNLSIDQPEPQQPQQQIVQQQEEPKQEVDTVEDQRSKLLAAYEAALADFEANQKESQEILKKSKEIRNALDALKTTA